MPFNLRARKKVVVEHCDGERERLGECCYGGRGCWGGRARARGEPGGGAPVRVLLSHSVPAGGRRPVPAFLLRKVSNGLRALLLFQSFFSLVAQSNGLG